MSGYVAGAVWNTKMPGRTMKTVLASLGDNASDEGFAWPSVDTIAERTMYSRRAVIMALAALEAGGWISKEQHPDFHRNNAYRLNFEKLNFSRPKGSYKAPKHPDCQVQPLHLTNEASSATGARLKCNPRHSQVQTSASQYRRTVIEPSEEQKPAPVVIEDQVVQPDADQKQKQPQKLPDESKSAPRLELVAQQPKGADPRFQECMAVVKVYVEHKGFVLQWGPAEGAQLKRLLRESPGMTVDVFKDCLRARARSAVSHGEPPCVWLPTLLKYQDGRQDRYKVPDGESRGSSNGSVGRNGSGTARTAGNAAVFQRILESDSASAIRTW